MPATFANHPVRERGAVLFVALVFLVIFTLLALTATSTSILQERMTGGLRNSHLALMGAESTLRSVEWGIWNRSSGAAGANKLDCNDSGGATGDACYKLRSATQAPAASAKITAFRNAANWLATGSDGANAYATATLNTLSGAQASAQLQNQPRYLVEDLGIVLPPNSPPSGQGGSRFQIGGTGPGNQTLYSFRITARSTGGNQGSVRAAESHFIALPPSH